MEQFLGRRYFRESQFCIQYFPETAEIVKECHEVGEAMYFCLEYITCQGDDRPIRGTKMHYELKDDVLNFFVNYDLLSTRQRTSPLWKNWKLKQM